MQLASKEDIRAEGEKMMSRMQAEGVDGEAIDRIRLIIEYATNDQFRAEMRETVARINGL